MGGLIVTAVMFICPALLGIDAVLAEQDRRAIERLEKW